MRRRGVVVAVIVTLACGACISHPVGPARTYGKYEGKARTTADSALSAVNTVRIAARTGSRGHGFGPYLSTLISEQEEALNGLQGTFASIQPPDARADELRDELGQILSDAVDHVGDVRIAARRGELAELARVAGPLAEDTDALEQFSDAHQ